jgi:hypothetical protein
MRSSFPVSLALALSSLAACGDEHDPADLYLEPLCGDERAIELLAFSGESISEIERLNADDDLFVELYQHDVTDDGVVTSTRGVIVDRCGDEVTELAPGITDVMPLGDALVACLDGDLVRLARYDDPAPTLLSRGGCAVVPVGERWVAFAAEPGAEAERLVALDVVGSEVEVRTLLDDVDLPDIPELPEPPRYVPSVIGSQVFAWTTSGALLSVDPRTGETTLEIERDEMEAASFDEAAIAYRAPVPAGQNLAPIVLRDRQTGADQPLAAEIPAWWVFFWEAPGVLTVTPEAGSSQARWFLLDPVRELVVPEAMDVEKVRTDGYAWLSQRDEATQEVSLLRWREGEEPREVLTCTKCKLAWVDHEAAWIDVLVETETPARYELWRLDDLEGPARMLADGVGERYEMLDDGRILSVPLVMSGQWGPLELFESADEPGVMLFRSVEQVSLSFTVAYGGGDILYSSGLGSPHGLFRARLAQ